MLIELYGRNFGCFRDEFLLSMLATDIDPGSDRGIVTTKVRGDDEPLRLLRAVALYGPNASGKSTVIRAASALSRLLGSRRWPSDAPLRSYEPFALGQQREPVKLGAKAVIDGEVYDYCISFDRQAFQSEKLTRLNGEDPVVLIDRIGQDVTGAWKEEAQFQLLSKSFRANALLLSLADILAPGLAKRISVGFRRVLATRSLTPGAPWSLSWRVGHPQSIARRARKDTEFSEWLLSRLKHADLGVVGLRTEEERQLTLFSSVDEESGEEGPPREGVETFVRLALLHGGTAGPVELPYLRESLGTQRLVELSPLLYDLAHDTRSRAAFVDEFDASMHPLLLHALIRHFNCEIPPDEARGQLIFATHETALLDDEAKHAVLRRDQVYFTEKDASGASRLYSVAEFKERNNLNVRRRYLQGRYGALPSLGLFAE